MRRGIQAPPINPESGPLWRRLCYASGMTRKAFQVLATCSLLALLAGCGRKAEPLPPIIEVPETTTDLAVRQDVDQVVLTWSYPALTRAGRPLNDLARIAVWRLIVPPGQEQVGNEDLKRQLMLARGEVIARLEGDALERATRGGKLEYRDPLPPYAAGSTPPTLWYAVRTRRADGTTSALSNIAGGQPQTVPPALGDVQAATAAEGIRLSWDPIDDATYLVERRGSGAAPWEPVDRPPSSDSEYLDASAGQGLTWRYRVRVVNGPIWGPPSDEVVVPYPDVYPPPPVRSFVCLPEPGRVVLRWEPPSEAGVRYTAARRARGEAEWTALVTAIAGLQAVDNSPPDGPLEYGVRTIDLAGNESEMSTCETRTAR